MPRIELTDEEAAVVADAIREAMKFDRFLHRSSLLPLKSALAKLAADTAEPEPERPK